MYEFFLDNTALVVAMLCTFTLYVFVLTLLFVHVTKYDELIKDIRSDISRLSRENMKDKV